MARGGQMSVSFIIWDKLKNPKIWGKIISLSFSEKAEFNYVNSKKEKKCIKGQIYCIKLQNIFYYCSLYCYI